MIDRELKQFFDRYRLSLYKMLFQKIKEREGSLSATESFAVDVIYLLDRPTIKQFSDYLGISQPNATYKIASLMEKGYVRKEPSAEDKREFHLVLTEKFFNYYGQLEAFTSDLVETMKATLSEDEISAFAATLAKLNDPAK